MGNEFITIFDKTREELVEMKLCISCSCGKDSICVAIICHERNIPIHSIIRYTNDSDWSCMENEWERLKQLFSDTDTKFVVLVGTPLIDQIKRVHLYRLNGDDIVGYVPCGPLNRFGTKEKVKMLEGYVSEHGLIDVVGLASDERRWLHDNKAYPLVELGVPEKECLKKCYEYGFSWNQLTDFGFYIRMYDFVNRLSCIYCGYCNSDQLALIVAYFPSVYQTLCQIQMLLDVPFKMWSSAFNLPEKLDKKILYLQSMYPDYFNK